MAKICKYDFCDMKIKLFVICLLIATLDVAGQSVVSEKEHGASTDCNVEKLLEEIYSRLYAEEIRNRYKIYVTENIYNVLRLDTKTGQIDQVQWSLEFEKEGSVTINSSNLALSDKSLFELYPTQNMYQFILLDKSDGRTWHVQWGIEENKRWIRMIY